MGLITGQIRNQSGDVVGASTVLVKLAGTGTSAGLFTDLALSISAANPFTTDAAGAFSFYAADGLYDLTVTYPDSTTETVFNVAAVNPTLYALLAGRAGGQSLRGGTAGGDNLTLSSTVNATKGKVIAGVLTVDEVNGRVGIGWQSPDCLLAISGNAAVLPAHTVAGTIMHLAQADGAAGRILMDGFATNPSFDFRRADGTAAAPTALLINEVIGQFSFFGYGASVFSSGGRGNVQCLSAEGWTNTAQGTMLRFGVTATGSVTVATQLTIDGAGNLLLGASSPGTSLAHGIALPGGTAPSTSPAGEVQVWCLAAQSNDSQLYVRNEAGKVERLTGLHSRVSAQFNATSATLANVTGLSLNVDAGKTYQFIARLYYDANATGGHKYAVSGTATATAVIYQITSLANATNLNVITARQTALAGSSGQAGSTGGYTEITGTITVNVAGTLTVQFAQNTASGTSSVLVGSTFDLIPTGD